jgi:hypothetical protein
MLKNYFKTAWRNLVRNKFSSLINIVDICVGMAVVMLIGLWIYDELSFDKAHKNYKSLPGYTKISQTMREYKLPGMSPYPLVNELRKNYGSDF